jgi:hypothetical protein
VKIVIPELETKVKDIHVALENGKNDAILDSLQSNQHEINGPWTMLGDKGCFPC